MTNASSNVILEEARCTIKSLKRLFYALKVMIELPA